ncbi:MAG: tRNA (adenosine(37)-N6)-threonylcarbamoyltransferase complex dimerization subunit type 1 TsaB [Bacillota bacterium]
MRVLAIDSATNVAGVAVAEDNRLIAEFFFNTNKTHSQRLLPMVAKILQETALELGDMDGLAVTIGPGSFTGLRIGLATVKGLALTSGLPLVGVPTLDALAWNGIGGSGLICPVLNARRQEVYTCLYRAAGGGIERLSSYMAVSPQVLGDILAAQEEPVLLMGDGVDVCRKILLDRLGSRLYVAHAAALLPRAAHAAFLGLERLAKGDTDSLHSLSPLYIRQSEAELKWAAKNQACKG